MKIILRDIIRNYFPKYLPLYESLSQSDKQLIFSYPKSDPPDQKEQFTFPEMTINKSSIIKDKELTNGKRSQSKDDLSKTKSGQVRDVMINSTLQSCLTNEEERRIREIMNQRTKNDIIDFINTHRFHTSSLSTQNCLLILSKLLLHLLPHQSSNQPSKSRSAPKPTSQLNQNLYKLSLYLNKQTNKQIFTVYEYILAAGPKNGVSYETLAKKLKTDIINVSHYCCKLKKMRFVDWEHKKEGVLVFPKVADGLKLSKSQHKDQQLVTIDLKQQQKSFDYTKSFIFSELTLNENILVNVSSSASLLQGGLTNEQIKLKIMKHAENKMIRRTVEGMRPIQRHAQRQGKVFEFKYKKETPQIIREMDRKRVQTSGIIELTESCRSYLNENYASMSPQSLVDEELLQHIVNTRLTDYVSSIGIKQSKRQCTPLKLNRYIHILNYLERQGPENELYLRRHIIEVEKELVTYQGIVHKRSVIGILEGLRKIQLVREEDGFFYASWVEGRKRRDLDEEQYSKRNGGNEFLSEMKGGNKKLKTDKMSKDNKKRNDNKIAIPLEKIRMITKRQHLSEIFTQLLNFTFQKALKRVLRKGFHRIMYAHRKKQSIPMFTSEPNIFHLLDQDIPQQKPGQQHATTLESFMSQINHFVSTEGRTLEGLPEMQYEVVKYVRRNPNKNGDNLRSKYGKGWREKFEMLERQGVIKISEEGYETLDSFEGYLV